MIKFAQAKLTVPEAALVTGLTEQDIDREIDAKVIRSSGRKGTRALSAGALVYLKAIGPVRGELAPALRKKLCTAVTSAVANGEGVARVDMLQVDVKSVRSEVLEEYEGLERLKRVFIESRPSVLGGEPVLKGTRVSVRIVADLVKKGTSKKEIKDELDLSEAQIEAALTFDRITPRRGRPPMKRRKETLHVPADR